MTYGDGSVRGRLPCDGNIVLHALEGGPVEYASQRCQAIHRVARPLTVRMSFTTDNMAAAKETRQSQRQLCLLYCLQSACLLSTVGLRTVPLKLQTKNANFLIRRRKNQYKTNSRGEDRQWKILDISRHVRSNPWHDSPLRVGGTTVNWSKYGLLGVVYCKQHVKLILECLDLCPSFYA